MTDAKLSDALFEAESRALVEAPLRRPVATYRLQLHKGFTLANVVEIVPYLHDLGITDVYLSPYLDARPGSTHGYDVFDHGRINPEVGDDTSHDRLVVELSKHGMGRVLDVVPNHMGINGPNRFWLDVLELGPHSPFAGFFDIDWQPIKEELEGRILLPILEDQYGRVLEDGKLVVERRGGSFVLRYHQAILPLAPRSYAMILGRGVSEITEKFDLDDPNVLEYLSIWSSAEHLPSRTSSRPEDIEFRIRERLVLKTRIGRLCEECPALRDLLDRVILGFQGNPGDPSSFDALHRLLEEQVYRLAFWRVAAQEINYRRFFDINDLAGLRTEDPRVYDAIHALIFHWIEEGGVTGLRIDHPDGLADPTGYFCRLQESVFLLRCRRRFDADGHDPSSWLTTAAELRRAFREASADPASPLARPFPIVAEKILCPGENLPEDWPIDGTVGYEFLNVLNGLFVDPDSASRIESIHAEFTGDREPFTEVLYRSKRLIAHASLASEINALARQLNRVSECERRYRDFTLNDLRLSLREVIACFPVYRTYVQPNEPASARDRSVIDQAVARARRRTPSLDTSVFDFLRSVLLNDIPDGTSPEARSLRAVFVRRFQQTTGPIQAKGLEDTAFYRQVKLASLNEVGADPWRFGHSPAVFHAMNAQRLSRWPGALGTTATHDTKRGEDARIRIDALSELAEEWGIHLARWAHCHATKKAEVYEKAAPDAAEEYLLYQTLLGTWPSVGDENAATPEFVARIQAYLTKAAREAKINTSWNDTDPSYVEAIAGFVSQILEGPDSATFLRDFILFQARIARVAIVHSLSQTLLKLTSPGVPDIYQGCDLWDFSLVDPDNRRPVDFGRRRELMADWERELAAGDRRGLAVRLLANPEDGAIKQYLIATVLRFRREHADLFARGVYLPLFAEGQHASRIVAFGRHDKGQTSIIVATRHLAGLMGQDAHRMPIGREIWGSTRLVLPDGAGPGRWRDLLTEQVVQIDSANGRATLHLGEVLRNLPVSLLVAEPTG